MAIRLQRVNYISKQEKEFLETLDLKILFINETITENNKI
jgi:hypothetical protein